MFFNDQFPEAAAGMLHTGAPLLALLLCLVIAFFALRFFFQCLFALIKLSVLGVLFALLIQFAAVPEPSPKFWKFVEKTERDLTRFAEDLPHNWAHIGNAFSQAKESNVSELILTEELRAALTMPDS